MERFVEYKIMKICSQKKKKNSILDSTNTESIEKHFLIMLMLFLLQDDFN